jgi:hypothetical protein
MDDAMGVRGVQSVGDLNSNLKRVFKQQRLSGDAMLQRLPIEELHGDVGLSFMLSDFVNRADIGMVKSGGCAGFALEPFDRLRVFRQRFGQELQSDEAAELGVFSLVHHTHTAAPEFIDDAIVRDGLADQRVGGWHVEHILGCAPRQVNEGEDLRASFCTT